MGIAAYQTCSSAWAVARARPFESGKKNSREVSYGSYVR